MLRYVTDVRGLLLLLMLTTTLSGCGGGGGGGAGNTGGTTGGTGSGSVSGADVSVSSFSVPVTSANAGDMVDFSYKVTNTGGDLNTWFQSSVFLSFDPVLPSQSDHALYTSVVTVFYSGDSSTITGSMKIPTNLRSGTYYLAVVADSAGVLQESNLANNVSSVVSFTVNGTSCDVDSYEQDDTRATAITLDLNTGQQHNHCDDDADWYRFSAIANETYSLSTSNLGSNAYTRIRLFDTDGKTLLKTSGSGVEPKSSRISWTAPATGTYYAQVDSVEYLQHIGPNTEYSMAWGNASVDVGVYDVYSGSSATAGGTESVNFIAYNNGSTSSGSFQVKAYLSTDSVVDQNDIPVGTYTVGDLAPSATEYFSSINIAIPKDTTPGSYYLGFITDPDNTIAEFNEQNNLSEILPLEVIALTGCTLDSYEDDDDRAHANIPVFGEVQSHNFCDDETDWLMFDAIQGNSYVVRTVSLGGDANFAVYDPANNLLGGGGQGTCCTSSGTFQFVAPSTGTYYVNAWSSPYNGGANSDYTVAVYDDLPDMTVSYLGYEYTGLYVGGVINVWPETQNIGFEDATASETGIYLSTDATLDAGDIYLGARANNGIASFTSDSGWSLMAIPETIAPGDYYLIANADDTGQIMEIYEDNNAMTRNGLLTISSPLCAADAYEQDDLVDMAQPVSMGATQLRNFCDDEYDWMKIDLTQGQSVVFQEKEFQTVNFQLYDTDKSTVIRSMNNFMYWEAAAAGTYYVRAQNPVGTGTDYTLYVYSCDKDQYESDDTRSGAPVIAVGESQVHNMCDGTTDNLSFNAVAGVTYTISTSGLGANIDTTLELFDTVDAFFSIASNDNAKPNVLYSSITWTAPANGTYYIVVTNGGDKGAGTDYTITLQ